MIKFKNIIPFFLLCILLTNQTAFAQSTYQESLKAHFSATEVQTAELTLADIGFEESILLYGPYQKTSATFALPPDWNITAPVKLDLSYL